MTFRPDPTRLELKENVTHQLPQQDYAIISQTIQFISNHWLDQPALAEIAQNVGLTETKLQKLFSRWCGLSPKAFLQAVTLDHAKKLLHESGNILDASYDLGLSGPGRLHDLFVTHEAMTPGIYKAKGEGLDIAYGFLPCPFGNALLMVTDMGLAGLAFADPGGETQALEDMMSRWPNARYIHDEEAVRPYLNRIFDQNQWQSDQPLRVVLIGTDFEIEVWHTLLKIPLGKATSYSDIAAHLGRPKASRAVGTAVGKNPISFVVPCHRVLGKTGNLCGYHWGITRKQAILGWEFGIYSPS